MDDRIEILGIKIDVLDKCELQERVNGMLSKQDGSVIFTPNTEIVMRTKNNAELSKLFEYSDINIPDGVGLVIASKILGTPLPERLAGIELGEFILEKAERSGLSVFFLGGDKGIAERAKKTIEAKHKRINICGTHHGYFDVNGEGNEAVIKEIARASPDVLFVCMGFPRQEKWIVKNAHKIPCLRLSIGLGGSLDVWSENVMRAPYLFRCLSLEWLWRIINQPKRANFLLTVPRFFSSIIVQRYRNSAKATKTNGKNAH